MDAASGSWELRARAESFGARAEEYDATRPHYPDEVVAAVVAGDPPSAPAADGPVRVLDVGTGTGILARQLVAAGADVTGTDVDAAMAAVARRHGLTVHVGPFEQLDLDSSFDRVTVAQAWHWIEPEAGLATARRLLAPGGQLWLLWNSGEPAPAVQAALDAAYARFPSMATDGANQDVTRIAAVEAEAFLRERIAEVRTRAVVWRVDLSTAAWLRLMHTASDHVTLPEPERTALFDALGAAVDSVGGVVPLTYTTRAVVASGLSG